MDNDQTDAIIGAAMEVRRRLGPGFLEAVYQEALHIELLERGIPHDREGAIPIMYRNRTLSCPIALTSSASAL